MTWNTKVVARIGCAGVLLVLVSCAGVVEGRYDSDTVWIDRPLYFPTQEGMARVDAGAWRVATAGADRMRLVPAEGNAEVTLIARAGNHGEVLDSPHAFRERIDGEDAVRVVLQLPDDRAFEAVGSFDPVRRRGGLLPSRTLVPLNQPDLFVSAIDLDPAAPGTTDRLSITITAQNGGTATCSVPLLAVTIRNAVSGRQLVSQTRSLPPLDAGSWRKESWELPAQPAGHYEVVASASPTNATSDSDPDNNERKESFGVLQRVPVISTHPVDTSVWEGRALRLEVSAWGAEPLSYQWLLSGEEVDGATSPVFERVVTTADAGPWRCEVTNGYGKATSAAADVSVWLPPTIEVQPASQTVNLGDAVSLTVAASGHQPMTYQWQRDRQDIDGATDSTYTIDSADEVDAASYRCLVGNEGGTAESSAATLQVMLPPTLVPQPDLEAEFVRLLNEARVERGLIGLTVDARLSVPARAHTEDMASVGTLSHDDSDGTTYTERLEACGLSWRGYELLYAGAAAAAGPEQALASFMESEAHAPMIFDPDMRRIGVGCVETDRCTFLIAEGTFYFWTVILDLE
jgi:uncharacterized protein YkwD